MKMKINETHTTFEWGVKSVKEKLPPVTIKIRGKIHHARLTGRVNKFATVTVQNKEIKSGNPPWYDFHFSWITIANCLNNGNPLEA